MTTLPALPALPSTRAGAKPSLIALLATGAGISVASLYYNQPLLDSIARDLAVSPAAVGVLPTLTQVGYAAGIFLFAPLGDRFDLRRLILVKGTALAIVLALAGVAPSVHLLGAASLAIGLLATTAQDFIPAAAALAAPEARGKTVGMAMTGLLLGILLSRVVSGVVGSAFGWRAVYVGASMAVTGLVALASSKLPKLAPASGASYGALLRSIVGLGMRFEPLRRAALAQALLSIAFSGFWSTLALVLAQPPFHYGSAVAGAFGLAGAAGALVAPLAGSLADRRGPESIVRMATVLVAVSFVAMAAAPGSIAVLVAMTLLFDLGVHGGLIAHQSIVYALDPAARSRLNAVLVSAMFVGMAIGSAISSRLFAEYGSRGVSVLGATAALLALVVRLLPVRAPRGA